MNSASYKEGAAGVQIDVTVCSEVMWKRLFSPCTKLSQEVHGVCVKKAILVGILRMAALLLTLPGCAACVSSHYIFKSICTC